MNNCIVPSVPFSRKFRGLCPRVATMIDIGLGGDPIPVAPCGGTNMVSDEVWEGRGGGFVAPLPHTGEYPLRESEGNWTASLMRWLDTDAGFRHPSMPGVCLALAPKLIGW